MKESFSPRRKGKSTSKLIVKKVQNGMEKPANGGRPSTEGAGGEAPIYNP